jgi:hypothetical protein
VDLVLRPLSYFVGHPPLKIETFEVKNGHYLLHGTSNPCHLMPEWRAEDIPLFEGTWLFRNRGLGLLLAAAYFDPAGQISAQNRENFIIECTKAQLAMGDSALLLKRRYHTSYAERARRISSVSWSDFPDGEAVRSHYAKGLEQKLRPNFGKFATQDMSSWWCEITVLFERFYRYFEGQRLNTHINDWLHYERLQKPEDRIDLRSLLRTAIHTGPRLLIPSVWRLSLVKARKSKNTAAMALLLFAKLDGPNRKAYLSRASSLLAAPMTDSFARDWAVLTGNFLLLTHPAGEAGRVAKQIQHTAT